MAKKDDAATDAGPVTESVVPHAAPTVSVTLNAALFDTTLTTTAPLPDGTVVAFVDGVATIPLSAADAFDDPLRFTVG